MIIVFLVIKVGAAIPPLLIIVPEGPARIAPAGAAIASGAAIATGAAAATNPGATAAVTTPPRLGAAVIAPA